VTPANTTVALVVLVLGAGALAVMALWRLVQIRRRLHELHVRLLKTEAHLACHVRERDADEAPFDPGDPPNGGSP